MTRGHSKKKEKDTLCSAFLVQSPESQDSKFHQLHHSEGSERDSLSTSQDGRLQGQLGPFVSKITNTNSNTRQKLKE